MIKLKKQAEQLRQLGVEVDLNSEKEKKMKKNVRKYGMPFVGQTKHLKNSLLQIVFVLYKSLC